MPLIVQSISRLNHLDAHFLFLKTQLQFHLFKAIVCVSQNFLAVVEKILFL